MELQEGLFLDYQLQLEMSRMSQVKIHDLFLYLLVPQKGGCTCICRANADGNLPGNIRPGDITFAFGEATACNCSDASKEAKRKAIHALGKKPKHVGCRCTAK